MVQRLEPSEIALDTPLGRLYRQDQDAAAARAAAQDKLVAMEAQRNELRHWLATTMSASANAKLFTSNQAGLILLEQELLGVRRAADRAVEIHERIHTLWIRRYGTYAHAVEQISGDAALHRPMCQEDADLLAEIRASLGDQPATYGGDRPSGASARAAV